MQVRLVGTQAECEEAARLVGKLADILECSDPLSRRGGSALVSYYLEVRLRPPADQEPEVGGDARASASHTPAR